MQIVETTEAATSFGPGQVLAVLSNRERRFLELCNRMRHGRFERVTVQNGEPVMVDVDAKAIQQVKLDG